MTDVLPTLSVSLPRHGAGRESGLRRALLRVTALRRAPLLLIVPLLFLSSLTAFSPTQHQSPSIHSDGVGYYSWTAAILHGDFNFCQWRQDTDVGALSARNPAHPDRCENKYPVAFALLRLPVMAPIALLTDHTSDRALRISSAEDEANRWCGVAVLLAIALLMWAGLRRLGVSSAIAQLTCLLLVFGTGVYYMCKLMAKGPSLPHDGSDAHDGNRGASSALADHRPMSRATDPIDE